jgi:hypothetical protein
MAERQVIWESGPTRILLEELKNGGCVVLVASDVDVPARSVVLPKEARAKIAGRQVYRKAEQRDRLVAYPEHCMEPSRCAGKGYCPREITCVD